MPVRSRRRDDEEEEDDAPRRRGREPDSDDRPVKKKKKRRKASASGIPPALIFGGVGVLLLVIVVVVVVAATQGSGKTPRPSGGPGNGGVNPSPGNTSALALNQKINDANNRLAAAGTQFGQALTTYFNQGGKDTQAIRGQVQNMQNTFRTIRAEVASLPVPTGIKGQTLREVYLSYLDSGEAWAKELGAILENGSLSQQQKITQMQQSAQRMSNQERGHLANVARLQAESAAE